MKLAAFVNILASNRDDWDLQFTAVGGLPHISAIELWIEDDLSQADLRWIREQVEQIGVVVAVHAPFVGVALASHVEGIRRASVERVLGGARIAEALGATSYTCHSGPVGAWVHPSTSLRTLATSLDELVKNTVVPVNIENMPARSGGSEELLTSAAQLRELLDLVPGLGVTLDVGHCVQNGEDPTGVIENLGSAVRHVHIHDGFVGGRAHLPIGTGELPLDAVLDALADFPGLLSVETIGEEATRQSFLAIAAAMNGIPVAAAPSLEVKNPKVSARIRHKERLVGITYEGTSVKLPLESETSETVRHALTPIFNALKSGVGHHKPDSLEAWATGEKGYVFPTHGRILIEIKDSEKFRPFGRR